MSRVVHVISVGMNKERVMESIKMSGYPIQRAYLVLPKEKSYQQIAEDIEKALSVLVEIKKIYIDEYDVYGSAIEILENIKQEMEEGAEIYINASDAPRTLIISCYIVAQLLNGKLYIALPKFEKGKEVGIAKVVEIQAPPLKKMSEDKLRILKVIDENGGEVESINSLIKLIEGKLEKHKAYMAQRAKMSYHLKGLEKDGLVEMRREDKNLRIRLTPLGKAFCIIH